MQGTVTKLKAALSSTYATDRYVIGTNVTIQHVVEGKKKREGMVRVDSTVFLPPNSVLPYIGDVVEVGVFAELKPEAIAAGDLETIELPDDND